jgi:hypothetical protein
MQVEERRDAKWPADRPRERRRPRWGEFREAYPRVVTALALGLIALVGFDAWLLVKRSRYARQIADARNAMSTGEQRRADAILAASEGRAQLQLALVQRDATLEDGLNLAVSLQAGRLTLQREGAELHEMPIRLGAEKEVGVAPDTVRLALPRGRFTIERVVDASYRWTAPQWLFQDRGFAAPAARDFEGGLGPVAILLSGGAIIYSDAASGPLQDATYVMPGAVRVPGADLKAIAGALEVGMPVYFF